MNSEVFSTLKQHLRTVNDRNALIQELEEMKDKGFNGNTNHTALSPLRETCNSILNSQEDVEQIIIELKQLPIVEIETAKPLSSSMYEHILNTIDTYISTPTVRSFSTNPRLIAGCRLYFKGKTHELSIRKYIDLINAER